MERALEIESGKCYRTRIGQKVKVFATDLPGDYPVLGCVYICAESECDPLLWTECGSSLLSGEIHPYDLVAEWEDKPKFVSKTLYRQVFKSSGQIYISSGEYLTEEAALADKPLMPGYRIIGVCPMEIKVLEGEL